MPRLWKCKIFEIYFTINPFFFSSRGTEQVASFSHRGGGNKSNRSIKAKTKRLMKSGDDDKEDERRERERELTRFFTVSPTLHPHPSGQVWLTLGEGGCRRWRCRRPRPPPPPWGGPPSSPSCLQPPGPRVSWDYFFKSTFPLFLASITSRVKQRLLTKWLQLCPYNLSKRAIVIGFSEDRFFPLLGKELFLLIIDFGR